MSQRGRTWREYKIGVSLRFKLLSQVDLFAEHLNEKTVNEEIFSHIQTGFTDQEPMIREKTVISMIHLAPKLSFANLDEMVVMRHFARLLRDEQAGIRTNTAVCLGKIARHLHHATRQKVLIPAFIGKSSFEVVHVGSQTTSIWWRFWTRVREFSRFHSVTHKIP